MIVMVIIVFRWWAKYVHDSSLLYMTFLPVTCLHYQHAEASGQVPSIQNVRGFPMKIRLEKCQDPDFNVKKGAEMPSTVLDSDWLWLWLIFTLGPVSVQHVDAVWGGNWEFCHLIVLRIFAGHQKPPRYAWWVSVPRTIAPWATTVISV